VRAAASAGAGLKLRGARISTAMLRTLGTAPAAVREKSTGLPPFLQGCAGREAPKTSQSEAPGMLHPTGSRPTRSCFSTQLFYDALYEGFAPAQTAPHSASRFMIASAGATGTRWTAQGSPQAAALPRPPRTGPERDPSNKPRHPPLIRRSSLLTNSAQVRLGVVRYHSQRVWKQARGPVTRPLVEQSRKGMQGFTG